MDDAKSGMGRGHWAVGHRMGAVATTCAEQVCWSSFFTQALEWATVRKKCGPVPSNNSFDAEIGSCAMLMGSFNKRVIKRVNGHYVHQGCLPPIHTMHFSVECCAHELVVTEHHTPTSICGCLVAQVCAAAWSGLCVAEGRAFSLIKMKEVKMKGQVWIKRTC